MNLKATELDVAFHQILAEAAGYRYLSSELSHIRNRLRLFAGAPVSTAEQLAEVAEDHRRIIDAIRPRTESRIGDVVRAKLAIRSHLRSAVERLQLQNRMRINHEYSLDSVFDAPADLATVDPNPDETLLFVIRLILELLVASELSRSDLTDRLVTPTTIHKDMSHIALDCKQAKMMSDSAKYRFIDLDIQFHASLAFLSGLFFAEEAIIHIWQQLYTKLALDLTIDRMGEVVNEHKEIIRTLFYHGGGGNVAGRHEILSVVMMHLFSASTDSKKNNTMDTVVKDFFTWFLKHLSI